MSDSRGSKNLINKEFIPIFYILIIPVFSYLEGYGVISPMPTYYKDVCYFITIFFGLFMNFVERKKIMNLYFFIPLLILLIIRISPLMSIDRYFNGNFLMLLISDATIICFYFLVAISFWTNDPYFVTFYKSNLSPYRIIYKIIGLYFAGICIVLIALFVKIFLILKEVY
ncbi:MAG: hypothetical protein KA120_04760 [Candidatus Goldbacteria bacterium]|nr:hypothetical protein [Candidatus Goldiibacteriota bacterium]